MKRLLTLLLLFSLSVARDGCKDDKPTAGKGGLEAAC